MLPSYEYELGFLGAGNMAEAIATAAITHSVLPADQIIASDPSEQRRGVFSRLGVTVSTDNAQVIRLSRQVILAVKPQMMAQVAADLGRLGSHKQVVLSIMAGVSSGKLAAAIAAGAIAADTTDRPQPPRIVRIMPNTPLQVGHGMAGIALGEYARSTDADLAMRLFGAGGRAILVDESMLDAITAVSGSGPAYVFYLAEAMEQAARELGLAEHAGLLVRQTLLGAAHLLASTDQDPLPPAELRRRVTSPGGTTQAATDHLDAHQAKQVWIDAIKAARQRSVELGG